jgi:O-antigen ligase
MAAPEPSLVPAAARREPNGGAPAAGEVLRAEAGPWTPVAGDRAGRLGALCQEIIIGLLMALVVVLPLSRARWARSAILVGAAVLWVARWLLGSRPAWRRTGLEWPIACFAGWALLSALASIRPLYSLEKFGQEPLSYFGLFFLVLAHVRTDRDHRRILGMLSVGLALIAGYGLWEWSRPWYPRWEYVRSLTAGGTYLGAYLAAAIPVAAAQMAVGNRMRKGWWGLVSIAGLLCAVPNNSRAAWAGVGIALLFLAFTLARWLWLPLVAVGAAAPLIFGPSVVSRFLALVDPTHLMADSSTMDRVPVWIFALGEILKHPLLGFGFGREIAAGAFVRGYESGALVVQGGRLGYAHNTFLDVGLQMGLVGLLLLVWLLGAALVGLWRAWRAAPPGYPRAVTAGVLAMALAFPVRAMTNNYFTDDPVVLFWFLAALALAAAPAAAVPSPSSRAPGPPSEGPRPGAGDPGPGTRDAGPVWGGAA